MTTTTAADVAPMTNAATTTGVGFWADWPPAVRLEFVAELAHYAKVLAYPEEFPEVFLSPLAETVRAALNKERGVDLVAMKVAEFGEGAGDADQH